MLYIYMFYFRFFLFFFFKPSSLRHSAIFFINFLSFLPFKKEDIAVYNAASCLF